MSPHDSCPRVTASLDIMQNACPTCFPSPCLQRPLKVRCIYSSPRVPGASHNPSLPGQQI
eukprot:jgi/Botrbrau1/10909/Bobra.0025s0082.1